MAYQTVQPPAERDEESLVQIFRMGFVDGDERQMGQVVERRVVDSWRGLPAHRLLQHSVRMF